MSADYSKRWILGGMSFPAIMLLLPFIGAVVLIIRFSFSAEQGTISGFTLANYQNLFDDYFLAVLWTTMKLAFVSTVCCLLFSIPIALVLAAIRRAWWRRVITVMVLLPMILNLLIQSYGWIMVLSGNGIINQSLLALGLSDKPVALLFNEFGVLVGLVQTTLPLAVFPILSAMRAVKMDYLESASGLGATPARIFFDITLPLLKSGIIGAASIVFAYNASAFAVPLLLGGRKVHMVGTAIRDMISPYFEWANAAAAGVLLITLTLSIIGLVGWWSSRSKSKEAIR